MKFAEGMMHKVEELVCNHLIILPYKMRVQLALLLACSPSRCDFNSLGGRLGLLAMTSALYSSQQSCLQQTMSCW